MLLLNGAAAKEAIRRIEEITAEVEVTAFTKVGKVARLVDFGGLLLSFQVKDGLVHLSQIADKRVEKVSDYLTEGQEVPVKVLKLTVKRRVRLLRKKQLKRQLKAKHPLLSNS